MRYVKKRIPVEAAPWFKVGDAPGITGWVGPADAALSPHSEIEVALYRAEERRRGTSGQVVHGISVRHYQDALDALTAADIATREKETQ